MFEPVRSKEEMIASLCHCIAIFSACDDTDQMRAKLVSLRADCAVGSVPRKLITVIDKPEKPQRCVENDHGGQLLLKNIAKAADGAVRRVTRRGNGDQTERPGLSPAS